MVWGPIFRMMLTKAEGEFYSLLSFTGGVYVLETGTAVRRVFDGSFSIASFFSCNPVACL